MTTLAQFRTAIAAEIGLDNSTSGDQPSIDLWVNDGVTDVVNRSDCRIRCATLTLTAGAWKYTLPTTILKIMTCYVATSTGSYPLEMVSEDDIIAMQSASSASISPAQYYAVAGSDFLLMYPTPASADTLNIFYVPRPAVLSASSDSPSEIPAEFHRLVEYYAEARAASFSDDGGSQMGNSYRALYEQELRRMKRQVWLKGGHRMPLASVRSRIRRLPYHDRSAYPTR